MKYIPTILVIIPIILVCGCGKPTESIVNIPDKLTYLKTIAKLDTPSKVNKYMQGNFAYLRDSNYTEEFLPADVTFERRGGDCDDWAMFAYTVLKQHGYAVQILNVFTAEKGHSVCVWFEDDQLGVIGNRVRDFKFGFNSIEEVCEHVYSDWKVYSFYPSFVGIPREEN